MTALTATVGDRLEQAWARTDRLLAHVLDAGWTRRPLPESTAAADLAGRGPAFAWHLVGTLLEEPGPRPDFTELFVGAGRGARARPPREALAAWTEAVRERVRARRDEVAELGRLVTLAGGGRAYFAIVEHEALLHEQLVALILQLGPDGRRPLRELPVPGGAREAERRPLAIPGGVVPLGARFEHAVFGWDHEFPVRRHAVAPFAIDSTPATNAELLAFVEDGGYARPELWDPASRDWLAHQARCGPVTWARGGRGLQVRTLAGPVPFELARDWPAHVSWAEADAYARWRGARLPTEAEIVMAGYGRPDGTFASSPWGEAAPSARRTPCDLRSAAAHPVGHHPAARSAFGLEEVVGNGWEWTATTFARHRGFTPARDLLADDSQARFDGCHRVAVGASWVTDAGLVRRSFRRVVHRHDRTVLAKLRLVTATG